MKHSFLYLSLSIALGLVANNVSANEKIPEIQLVGIKLNGQSVSGEHGDYLLDMLVQNNREYLPLTDLEKLTGMNAVPISDVNNPMRYRFDTPIGQASLAEADISAFNNITYIDLASLKKLGISARFEQSDLAILLNMSYRKRDTEVKTDNAIEKTEPVEIEYYPQTAGLLSAYLDSNSEYQKNQFGKYRSFYNSFGAFGYAANGVWGLDMNYSTYGEGQSKKRYNNLENVYWTTSGKHFAGRVGVNQGSGDLYGSNEYTGLTLAYSNKGIERHLSLNDSYTSTLLQGQFNDLQNISGTAVPGGVAELRINQRAIARVLIGLDGRYEFLNLDVSQLDLANSEVDIAIYEYPQATTPVKVENISLGKRRSRASTGEWLLEAGSGMEGNAFDDRLNEENGNEVNRHIVSNFYAEYGLSNRIAVRGGIARSHNGSGFYNTWHSGLNFAPTQNSNADIAYWHSPDSRTWRADYQYQWKNLSASYYISHYRSFYRKEELNTDTYQSLNLSYRPNDKLSLNLSHSDERHKGIIEDHREKTRLGFDWYATSQFSMGGYAYTQSRDYYYRLSWNDEKYINRFDLQGNQDSIEGSWQHHYNPNTVVGLSLAKDYRHNNLLHQGFVHRQFGDNHSLNLGYSLYQGNTGFDSQWQYRPIPGMSIMAGYQHRYVDHIRESYRDIDEQYAPYLQRKAWQNDSYAYLRLRIDLYKPSNEFPHIGYFRGNQRGNVMINLEYPENSNFDAENMRFTLEPINQVEHRKVRPVLVQSELIYRGTTESQYQIHDIVPADYRLGLDSRNLPFEYSEQDLPKPTLRVDRYAPTYVGLPLTTRFGISGSLSDLFSGQKLELWQDNKLITQTESDEWGNFQMLDLPKGQYILKAKGYLSKEITIKDDFIMHLMLQRGK
ncbi:hypothetical protein [Actinobacillus genomosp. 1]|uniref:hypothetical protein n=1 Tax=Actinobacillus genomosp. 1 TaxID=254839 RepID=UPI002441FBB4|nr:hypothetical protein [Actinobacillus genomosp. 1]WGE90472.1 carboxypeptidase-like regulatory domain-containing protein [Actinobacillus genomosp. 1]